MTTINLPPEIEGPLVDEARRRGTTPELLAIESLRRLFACAPAPGESGKSDTLLDYLGDYIASIEGTDELSARESGGIFEEAMVDKHRRGRT